MDKFINKIEKTESCWNWIGEIKNTGYGSFYEKGKSYAAHRLVYEALVKKIPFGKVIDHLCRNRRCVNPDHLEVVSSTENILRGNWMSGINVRKKECKHGHPFSIENTIFRKRENSKYWRVCRECKSRINTVYQRKLKLKHI